MQFRPTIFRELGSMIETGRRYVSRSRGRSVPVASLFLLVVATAWTPSCSAQQSKRTKYAEVYKKYVQAACPVPDDGIRHFVYFARDREAMINHPFLRSERFSGAQIMYSWRNLEPAEGQYNFEAIQADLEYLRSRGKKLFIQLQDATFVPTNPAAPPYLMTDEFDGGQARQVTEDGKPVGWVCKRWNAKVRDRFAKLLQALGQAFDGKIEGINLQETAMDLDEPTKQECSPSQYAQAVKENMLAMKSAFPKSVTMQYANFMMGEWLPFDDQGYLRSVFEYGNAIGVGLGAPDLMVKRIPQLNHPLAMMHEREFTVPLGIAIQDGNYVGRTGADLTPGQNDSVASASQQRTQKSLVPMLHAFARDFLNVKYLFWVNQEPYFAEQVLPCIDPKVSRSEPSGTGSHRESVQD